MAKASSWPMLTSRPVVRGAQRRFTLGEQDWGFYTRYEDVRGARDQDRFDQWELGFNYWPTEKVVLKFDYRSRTHDLASESGEDFDAFDLGVGYQF